MGLRPKPLFLPENITEGNKSMATITKTLVCVDSADRRAGGSGSDHNKYYKASYDGSTIYYEYGRIGATCTKGQKAGTRASYQ